MDRGNNELFGAAAGGHQNENQPYENAIMKLISNYRSMLCADLYLDHPTEYRRSVIMVESKMHLSNIISSNQSPVFLTSQEPTAFNLYIQTHAPILNGSFVDFMLAAYGHSGTSLTARAFAETSSTTLTERAIAVDLLLRDEAFIPLLINEVAANISASAAHSIEGRDYIECAHLLTMATQLQTAMAEIDEDAEHAYGAAQKTNDSKKLATLNVEFENMRIDAFKSALSKFIDDVKGPKDPVMAFLLQKKDTTLTKKPSRFGSFFGRRTQETKETTSSMQDVAFEKDANEYFAALDAVFRHNPMLFNDLYKIDALQFTKGNNPILDAVIIMYNNDRNNPNSGEIVELLNSLNDCMKKLSENLPKSYKGGFLPLQTDSDRSLGDTDNVTPRQSRRTSTFANPITTTAHRDETNNTR